MAELIDRTLREQLTTQKRESEEEVMRLRSLLSFEEKRLADLKIALDALVRS